MPSTRRIITSLLLLLIALLGPSCNLGCPRTGWRENFIDTTDAMFIENNTLSAAEYPPKDVCRHFCYDGPTQELVYCSVFRVASSRDASSPNDLFRGDNQDMARSDFGVDMAQSAKSLDMGMSAHTQLDFGLPPEFGDVASVRCIWRLPGIMCPG